VATSPVMGWGVGDIPRGPWTGHQKGHGDHRAVAGVRVRAVLVAAGAAAAV